MYSGPVLALVASVLFTCAASHAAPVRSLLEARHASVVMQEWDPSGASASLATILTYDLGHDVSEKKVAYEMLRKTQVDRVQDRGGFSLLDMKRFAAARGFRADGYGDMSNGHLLRMAPVIVSFGTGGQDQFVVFNGVRAGRALIADPAFGNRSMAFDDFVQRWKGRIGFVVRDPRAKRRSNHEDAAGVRDEMVRTSLDSAALIPLREDQLAQLRAGSFETFASSQDAAQPAEFAVRAQATGNAETRFAAPVPASSIATTSTRAPATAPAAIAPSGVVLVPPTAATNPAIVPPPAPAIVPPSTPAIVPPSTSAIVPPTVTLPLASPPAIPAIPPVVPSTPTLPPVVPSIPPAVTAPVRPVVPPVRVDAPVRIPRLS